MKTIVLGVGLAAMGLGAIMAARPARLSLRGARTEGEVVGQHETASRTKVAGPAGFTLYAPVVEFTHAGKRHRFTSSLATRDRVEIGTRVPVRFLASDPEGTADIASGLRMWALPVMALAIGAIFVALSRLIVE
jgi:Protein of unknown function (DUF3592)